LFDPSLPPGIVLETFLNGDFIVKTGSDSLIITEYETEKSLKIEKGMKFNSAGFLYKSPYDYPAYES
jgi:hypothetical protein